MINFKIYSIDDCEFEKTLFESEDYSEANKKFRFIISTEEHTRVYLSMEFGSKKIGFLQKHNQYEDFIIIKEFNNGHVEIHNDNCTILTTGFERSEIDNCMVASIINYNRSHNILTKLTLNNNERSICVI